ncbi:MAG: DNA primase [Methanosphaera sp.]|nr:DNA primase [Methanosphaera sp.]
MIKTSFINPFSSDAQKIVRQLGDMELLDNTNEKLFNIVLHTPSQYVSSDVNLPDTLKKLAFKRFEWFLYKKTENFDEKNYEYLFNPDIYEYDVVAFYLLCQAIAIGYGPDSREAKQFIESEKELISKRLEKIQSESYEFQSEFLRTTLNQLIDTNNIRWTDIKEVLELGELDLDNLLLSNGKVIVEYEDFIEEFGDLIEYRDPQVMYQVTCGQKLKIILLRNLIMIKTRDYIRTVSEKAKKMVEPNKLLLSLSEDIRLLEDKVQELKFSSGASSGNYKSDIQPVNFNVEAFPPCVRKCMSGIKSGGRNDAIVLFLTPFIAYARLCPGIFSMDERMKISMVDSSLEITNNEVIPLIYEAAAACSPPLFSDQPQEKININSKLGFGMHSQLKLDHEGETQWYTPMSCEKIKLHLSQLCVPNRDCKKIGNPLTYYNRKRRLLERQENNTANADNTEKNMSDE